MGKPRSLSPIHNLFGSGPSLFEKKVKPGSQRESDMINARIREAGRPGANLASDVAGSGDVSIRQKLDIINQLQRVGDRQVDLSNMDNLTDEQLLPLLNKAQTNLRDPFFAVSGDAFTAVQERFKQLVERNRESAARFQKTKEIRMDLPGQSQTQAKTLLGGSPVPGAR